MSAIIVEEGGLSNPLLGAQLSENEMVDDQLISSAIRQSLFALRAASPRPEPGTFEPKLSIAGTFR